MELEALLEAFAKTSDEKVGLRALAALKASAARGSLHVDRLRARFAKYPAKVKAQAESLIAAHDADAATRKKEIDALVAEVKKGDVRRGQAVFNSVKAACAACHAIGYIGGKIGPDLTHIGKVRDERDLLESILFPNASLVRSYEPVQVTTKQGVIHNGLVKQETAEAVVLTKSATEEVRVRRADVEEMVPSKVSIMPAGMDKTLTRQELLDLVAFLRACK
jgi:putative heme-binding domain-containing protein